MIDLAEAISLYMWKEKETIQGSRTPGFESKIVHYLMLPPTNYLILEIT